MTNLRIFFYGGLISYRALFAWQSPPVYIGTMLGFPVFQILFFTYLGKASGHTGADASFYIVGNSVAVCAMGGIFGMTQSVTGERWAHTLTAVLATPANRAALFLGRALPNIANGMFVCAVGFVVSAVVADLRVEPSKIPLLALIVTVSSFSCTGLGLAIGSIGIRLRDVFTIANPTYFLLMLFAGVEAPLAAFPHWVETIGSAVPLTHGVTAARLAVGGTAVAEEHFGERFRTPIAELLATEVMIGTAYFAAGYVLLRMFEIRARRHGSMEEV